MEVGFLGLAALPLLEAHELFFLGILAHSDRCPSSLGIQREGA